MSENLCYVDAYVRSVEARVRAVEAPPAEGRGAMVLLDRTVFYPGGGGQPADRGVLRMTDGSEWTVVAARRQGDEIWHELEPGREPPTIGGAGGSGAAVLYTADLDWDRRLRLMRTHTALHALCGVVWRDYGALVTGGNMEPGSGRMDFEFERMSGELVGAIETAVNDELVRGPRRARQRAPARRGVRDPRPDPDEGEPPAARHRGDPDDRDRRA